MSIDPEDCKSKHSDMIYNGPNDEVLCKECGLVLVGKKRRDCPHTGNRCIYSCDEDEDCWSEMNGG